MSFCPASLLLLNHEPYLNCRSAKISILFWVWLSCCSAFGFIFVSLPLLGRVSIVYNLSFLNDICQKVCVLSILEKSLDLGNCVHFHVVRHVQIKLFLAGLAKIIISKY